MAAVHLHKFFHIRVPSYRFVLSHDPEHPCQLVHLWSILEQDQNKV